MSSIKKKFIRIVKKLCEGQSFLRDKDVNYFHRKSFGKYTNYFDKKKF